MPEKNKTQSQTQTETDGRTDRLMDGHGVSLYVLSNILRMVVLKKQKKKNRMSIIKYAPHEVLG